MRDLNPTRKSSGFASDLRLASLPSQRFGEGCMAGATGHGVPNSLVSFLRPFRDGFTAPTWEHVLVLVMGAILVPGRRTVASALRVMPEFNSHDKRSAANTLNLLAAASQKAPFPLKCGATSAHVFLCAEWDRVATVAARTTSGPTRPDIPSRAKRAADLEFFVQPANQRIFQHPPGCGATRRDFP